MHPRKNIGADTVWNCDEMPPAKLIEWLAGVSYVFVDYIRLSRWRNEYESSIKRAIHLSDRK